MLAGPFCRQVGEASHSHAVSIFVFVGTMVFVNAVADGKPNASEYVFIAFCTAVPWVIGRALRYILAGE